MRQCSIRQLRLFIKLVETGSFTETARLHGTSQPALSRSIKEMELLLGVKLLDRSARSVSLTEMGSHFLPIATRLVKQFDAGFQEFEEYVGQTADRLVVAAISSMARTVLAPVLGTMKRLNPGLEFTVLGGMSDDVVSSVVEGVAEIGLLSQPDFDPRIIYEPIAMDDFVLVCRADDPLAKCASVGWEAFAKQTFLAASPRSSLRAIVDRQLQSAGVKCPSFLECQDEGHMSGFLAAGLGISALPRLLVPLMGEDFASVPLQPTVSRGLGVITRRDRPLTLAGERLMELVRGRVLGGRIL